MRTDVALMQAQQETNLAEARAAGHKAHARDVAAFARNLVQALPDAPTVPRAVVDHLLAAVAAFACPEDPHE